ncbi:MAG: hypothetical protein AAFO79_12185, partial [Pseudomonadota bacterium]
LAWKIATAAPPPNQPVPNQQGPNEAGNALANAPAGDPNAGADADHAAGGRPFTFLQAAAFQWVNPKAWSMALTAITLYASSRSLLAILAVAVVFGAINLPCVSCWAVLGQQMRRLLSSPARLQAFNWTMAVLLVASLVLMLPGVNG